MLLANLRLWPVQGSQEWMLYLIYFKETLRHQHGSRQTEDLMLNIDT